METLATIIISGLSGGGFAVIIEKIVDVYREKIAREAEKKKRENEKLELFEENYLSEKKSVYIDALQQLAEIRHGFDVTRDMLTQEMQDRIKDINDRAPMLSARLRLYSSDEIFNLYWQLSHWNIYAYTRPSGMPRLMENGKELFSIYTTILARLMQADLGFRELIYDPEMIECPKCGRKHDAYKTCECGMTHSKTFAELAKKFRDIEYNYENS